MTLGYDSETHPTMRFLERRYRIGSEEAASLLMYGNSKGSVEARDNVNVPFRLPEGGAIWPLHYVCLHGLDAQDLSITNALIDIGADMEARSSNQDTALLMCANMSDRYGFVILLTRRGANVSARSSVIRTQTARHDGGYGTSHQTPLGLVLRHQCLHLRGARPDRVAVVNARRAYRQEAIAVLRSRNACLNDADFWTISNPDSWTTNLLDEEFGAALTADNSWTFPPAFKRTARLCLCDVNFRRGNFLGLSVFQFLARGDIIDFTPGCWGY